jgi:hypothetical protein
MEASVKRVVIFGLAIRAKRKGRHCSLWAVIGDVFDDREARTAIGAVDERITITPIVGVKKLFSAIITYADIRGDGDEGVGIWLAIDDLKTRLNRLHNFLGLELIYSGESRGIVLQFS